MGSVDRAGAHVHRGTDDLGDAEVLEPDDRADDVHDGVHGPDLVEVDLVRSRSVDLRLDLGQPLEDVQALLLDRRGEGRAIDDLLDVREMAGRLFLLVKDDMDLRGGKAGATYLLA